MPTLTDQPIQESPNQTERYHLAAEVVLLAVPDGTSRLMDLEGESFALPEVATRMLKAVLDVGPTDAAVRVAQHYGVAVERVRVDMTKFIADMQQKGLLVRGEPVPRPRRLRERLASVVLAVLLRLTLLRPTLAGKVAGLLFVANLSCRWLGWAATVRLWQRTFTPPPQEPEGQAWREAYRAIDQAVRTGIVHSALPHACKERGLTAWGLGRRAGLRPRLVLGVSLCPVHAHCWAQLDGMLLGDDLDQIIEWQQVRVYE